MSEAVSVVGAGSWGTALAHLLLSKGIPVRLWCYDADVARELRRTRVNRDYLPSVRLPRGLEVHTSLPEVLEGARTILAVVPTQFIRGTFRKAAGHVSPEATVITAAKNRILAAMEDNAIGIIKDCGVKYTRKTIQRKSYTVDATSYQDFRNSKYTEQ